MREEEGRDSTFPVKLAKLTLPPKTLKHSLLIFQGKRNEAASQRAEGGRSPQAATPARASDFHATCLGPLGQCARGSHSNPALMPDYIFTDWATARCDLSY